MTVIQHISSTVWSTAHLSVCTVLGQGLSSGQCCRAPLTLLCLVTKQADGMALVRVKHPSISIYQIPCWCRELWFSSHCASMLADNRCTVQGICPKLLNSQLSVQLSLDRLFFSTSKYTSGENDCAHVSGWIEDEGQVSVSIGYLLLRNTMLAGMGRVNMFGLYLSGLSAYILHSGRL